MADPRGCIEQRFESSAVLLADVTAGVICRCSNRALLFARFLSQLAWSGAALTMHFCVFLLPQLARSGAALIMPFCVFCCFLPNAGALLFKPVAGTRR